MKKILLAFSWGHQFPEPGLSNEVMAKKISEIKNNFDIILSQIEIGEALKKHDITPDDIIGEPGIYMNTYEVAKLMVDWMNNKQIDHNQAELFVLCHKTHWLGCKMVLKKFSLSATRIPADIPYDKNSHQWYTRGPIYTFLGKSFRIFGYIFRRQM